MKRFVRALGAALIIGAPIVAVSGAANVASAVNPDENTCQKIGYPLNLSESSSGTGWSAVWNPSDGDGTVDLTVQTGYVVDLCVKKGTVPLGGNLYDAGSHPGITYNGQPMSHYAVQVDCAEGFEWSKSEPSTCIPVDQCTEDCDPPPAPAGKLTSDCDVEPGTHRWKFKVSVDGTYRVIRYGTNEVLYGPQELTASDDYVFFTAPATDGPDTSKLQGRVGEIWVDLSTKAANSTPCETPPPPPEECPPGTVFDEQSETCVTPPPPPPPPPTPPTPPVPAPPAPEVDSGSPVPVSPVTPELRFDCATLTFTGAPASTDTVAYENVISPVGADGVITATVTASPVAPNVFAEGTQTVWTFSADTDACQQSLSPAAGPTLPSTGTATNVMLLLAGAMLGGGLWLRRFARPS